MRIGTEPLDLHDLLAEIAHDDQEWQGFPLGTVMGHIHLHVHNLEEVGRFYKDVVGFDLITKYGRSAQFFSVGGYHHHIGMNTWAGQNIPPAPENSVGMRYFSLILPTEADKQQLLLNLEKADCPIADMNGDPIIVDPSGNKISILVDKVPHIDHRRLTADGKTDNDNDFAIS